MAGSELNVHDRNEIKRLWKLGFKKREISRICKVHRNTVTRYINEFTLENTVEFPAVAVQEIKEYNWTEKVDWEKVRQEFLSGVSLNVIHEELLESNKISIQYPGFWKQLQKRANLSTATMVKVHRPGERCEIDYADGIDILDPVTGAIQSTEFFVGVLCHSRYTFAEFTLSQKSADFLQSHVNMFEYFGGVPQVLSPDNLKSAVTKAHRYDPTINQAYTRLAEHYEVGVVPARVKSPTDKALVERTIQIFQRYFFMKVRHRTFTSLLELNLYLKEHLKIFNSKVHRIFKRKRVDMFTEEKPYLKPLPKQSYKVATFHRAVLSRDCHLMFDENYYSAPERHRGKMLDVWATSKTVEIFLEGDRVAVHCRPNTTRRFITDTSHYPAAQQAFAEEDVQKLINKSKSIGLECEVLIKALLESEAPLKHLRRSQGIIALSWKYTKELLEEACHEANRFNNRTLPYLERVIKNRKGVQTITNDQQVSHRSYNPHLRGIKNIH
tara:strand:- start:862 stop:2352 length:1491 start_codon:yes stop_codon:yes gene_type:complete